MFNQVMDACTENYECIVLDNTIKSNKIEDVVFWYKARMFDPKKSFRVGHPKFWNAHKRLYDPKHDDRELEDSKIFKINTKKPPKTVSQSRKLPKEKAS
eukprot:5265927-Pyramimonas_sp.AAC.1